MAEILIANALAIAGMMVLVWLLSLPRKDASIVDMFWGLGFVLVAWVTWTKAPGDPTRKLLLAVMITIWGLRLSAYIAWRNIGHGEDPRYQAMRKKAGDRFPLLSLIRVFLLQGVVMWIVSLPVQLGQIPETPAAFTVFDIVGVVVWATGVMFESVGDFQLARFKANPENKGKVLSSGLWRYTRHPNYFGDFLMWWGIFLITFFAAPSQNWWSGIGPLIMSFFLMKVSGVTLLEKSLKESKGSAYDEYVQRTNAFFPAPPKSS
ncbi:MAG: DUF1295 domain-containing protein [Planctomycetaceae bacterium]|nr:DUF1295 domain-containing protein [Planctomycetaceae bacterium]